MTSFWREGFWRTSSSGNVHWVTGHSVQRDEWERAVPQKRYEFLRHARAHVGTTSRLVLPNAECPVCRQPVFFYQNSHGSRVFFDELGPPWPKHPCTANAWSVGSASSTPIMPCKAELRSVDDIEFIRKWAGTDGESMFATRYSTGRWDIAVFVGCHLAQDFSVVVLETSRGYRYFLAIDTIPECVRPGQLVTHYRGWISYVDTQSLRTVDIRLRRVRTTELLNRFLGIAKSTGAN